jgi:hypothetical protein
VGPRHDVAPAGLTTRSVHEQTLCRVGYRFRPETQAARHKLVAAGVRRIFSMRHQRMIIGVATAVLGLTMAAAPLSISAQRESGVRIHVSDIDSALPIMHARLASVSAAPLPPTITDEHGDVTIDVAAGGRTVRVGKAGYAPESVPLAPGMDVVDVKLARGAAITGRVVDRLGVPVAGQIIRVTAKAEAAGQPRQAATNDLGEYRVGALPQGTYAVALVTPAAAAATADAIEHMVTVRRGDDVGGIDFTVTRTACSVRPAPPPAASPRTAVFGSSGILGRVLNAGGSPIPCVEVVAYRGTARAASAMTDADGRYALTQLPDGAFQLEFRRDGYVPLQWGQQQRGAPGRPVQVRRGEQLKNIDIALPQGGAISGTLLDEFLEPLENVTVRAMELRGDEDRPMAIATAAAETDDRGRYRLSGLVPGRYLVATVAGTEPPDRRTGKGYAPAYYPGVVEIASARAIDVLEQQEQQWIDFPREPARVVTISGTALNSRNDPVTDRVLLVASQRSGAVIAETQGADVKGTDGAFTIPNVPPGDYVLQATSKGDGGQEFGMQYVTVYSEDPPSVRIKTTPGATVRGRLIEDGSPLVDPRSFGLTAIPVDWDRTSVLAGLVTLTPAQDGTLALDSATGSRRFVLTSGPADWYLKSVRIQGRDVTDEISGFPLIGFGFARDLEVVVSNKGAVIEGDAMDGSSPATDFAVVLFSSDPDRWFHSSRFLKTVRANRAGRFRIEGIADGDYFIAATDVLDGSAGGAWQNRNFLQSLITGARRVRLREGDDRNLTLSVRAGRSGP